MVINVVDSLKVLQLSHRYLSTELRLCQDNKQALISKVSRFLQVNLICTLCNIMEVIY